MRQVQVHDAVPSKFTPDQIQKLQDWLSLEMHDAIGIRKVLESHWRDLLRMYESVPKNPVRNFPVENAPNYEVCLGAIAVDALYAQVVDLIFTITPLVTVRPVPHKKNDEKANSLAKALQRFVNWMAKEELKLEECKDSAILDGIKLGTMVLYTPWIEETKKTKSNKVLSAHPQTYAWPPEDVITPMGSNYTSMQTLRWLGLRFWPTTTELRELAKKNNWDLGENDCNIKRIGVKDWVKNRREALGRQAEGMRLKSDVYELIYIYCYYDIDEDGIEEDLFVVWDQTAKKVLFVSYNPNDCRPTEDGHYQKREHLFWSMGVLEMIKAFEEGASDFFNYWVLNSMQANTKDIVARAGVFPENWVRWPGRLTEIDGDPATDFKEVQMHSTDASLPQAIAMTVGFAERRVGLNDMNTPRPSQVLGSRTPGITALTMLQQVNKRFTPAFNSLKGAFSNSIKQGCYRYSEKLKALTNNEIATSPIVMHIFSMLGSDDGTLVIELLRKDDFAKEVDVEMTASAASVNSESDRQNAVILMNILAQYYTRTMELMTLMANPQVPQPIRDVAAKIATAMGEIIDRTIRTFDSMRDPAQFVIDVSEELDALAPTMEQQALTGLMQLIGNIGMGGGRQDKANTSPSQLLG